MYIIDSFYHLVSVSMGISHGLHETSFVCSRGGYVTANHLNKERYCYRQRNRERQRRSEKAELSTGNSIHGHDLRGKRKMLTAKPMKRERVSMESRQNMEGQASNE